MSGAYFFWRIVTRSCPKTLGVAFFCMPFHISVTMVQCCSASLIEIIIATVARFHRSLQAFSASSDHSSPATFSMTLMITLPRIVECCGFAPYCTCRMPCQSSCWCIRSSSSAKVTMVESMSKNFIAITWRGREKIVRRFGATIITASYTISPTSISLCFSSAASQLMMTSDDFSLPWSSVLAMLSVMKDHTQSHAAFTSGVHSGPRI
mmetsp:Transcript_23143/g.54882  ORF Transcript_23143/g.54882 Transcript_23143/m.54882 type:complete len:208 (-) Transcript_23143:1027-1650(-)